MYHRSRSGVEAARHLAIKYVRKLELELEP
jgi:hypothetical protein